LLKKLLRKNVVVRLENEAIIFGIIFGVVYEKPYEGFKKNPTYSNLD
jgi:hypothetical protein